MFHFLCVVELDKASDCYVKEFWLISFIFIIVNRIHFASGGKAAAQRVSGDRAAFFGCGILSYRDTLLDGTGSHYGSTCYIEGATDFICGNAASLFEVSATFYVLLRKNYTRANCMLEKETVLVNVTNNAKIQHLYSFIFIGMINGQMCVCDLMNLREILFC